MDEYPQFKALFQRLVNQYELSPEAAAELLRRIIAILEEERSNST